MSIVPPETPAPAPLFTFKVPVLPPAPKEAVSDSDETLHFDYPGSDIILRSRDSYDFRVPHLYLVNSSPVLRDLEHIRSAPETSDVPNGEEQEPLPVIKLPDSGAILYSLLTFIFPVAPVLPSTAENIMDLLAVAQKYQMDSVLTHIRGAISRQDPPFIRPETALHIYFLAQKHELRQEMLRAARSTLRLPMTIEALEDKIDFMPGAYLRELWKYHARVRKDLACSLLEFRKSGAPDIVIDLCCETPGPRTCAGTPTTPGPPITLGPPATPGPPLPASINASPDPDPQPIPEWLGDYIESLAEAPHLFDLIEFENVRASHVKQESQNWTCSCERISNQVIRAFWDALTTVVDGSIEKVRMFSVSTLRRDARDDEYGLP